MMLNFKSVTIGYDKKVILSNVNFNVKLGETICILGPNGIGKTTIFKTILGVIPKINGNITIDGVPIDSLSQKDLAMKFAYVPQAKNYSYQYTVEEIVLMGRALHIPKFSSPQQDDYDIVHNIMNELGIMKFKDKSYSELSGGEQQIVLIARAMAQNAKFIIMDEPASNLDYANQKLLLDVILRLNKKNIGILMSTHTPDHAFICCQKALLINRKGEYIYGSVSDVVTSSNLSNAYGVDIEVLISDTYFNTTKACGLLFSK